jgi:outer membrane lipoprotein-sorting protein
MKLIAAVLTFLATALSPVLADGPAIDPKARLLLDEMVKAYRSLHTLDQETVYSGGTANSSRVYFQRPNRISIEMMEPGQTGIGSRRVLCDGKNIYYFSQSTNQYSIDKAPGKLSDLPFMSGGLELAALAGLDAVAPLLKQAKSARLDEPVQVDGVKNDVIVLDISNAEKTGELRLYTGQADHLIRRFDFQSRIIAKPEPEPAQPDPPLEPGELPLEKPTGSLPVKFSYENRVVANKDILKDAFKWVVPPGAMMLHNNPNDYKMQSRKGKPLFNKVAEPIDTSDVTEPLDLKNEAKKVYASDLYKQAKKQRKK